jgi:hypothetical protein
MLRNIVGRFLSIVVSNISAKQMADGGAVKAYNTTMRDCQIETPQAAHQTHLQTKGRECVFMVQRDDVDGLVLTSNSLMEMRNELV